MNKVITAIAIVFAAATASAGIFDKIQPVGTGVSWDDVMTGFYTVKASHPTQARLFDVCYDGDGMFESINEQYVFDCNSPEDYDYHYDQSDLNEHVIVTGDLNDKNYLYKLTTQYPAAIISKVCAKTKKGKKSFPATMKKCAEWSYLEVETGDHGIGEGREMRSVCTGGFYDAPFPLTQTVEVFNDIDGLGSPKYFQSDSDTKAFDKEYTIPMCEGSVEPVPPKKG